MTRSLLHLGADRLDTNTLTWAHEAGLEVLVVDPNERSQARYRSDRFGGFELDDVDGILDWVRPQNAAPVAAVYSSRPEALHTVARLEEALGISDRNSRVAQPRAGHPSRAPRPTARHFQVNGFFRDGIFVRGGISELRSSPELLALQGKLPADLDSRLYQITESAARDLEQASGPVGARIELAAEHAELEELLPHFLDPMMTGFLTPLALGKSPFQAWFGTLQGTGGPFDSMPGQPDTWAGWMAIQPDHQDHTGFLEAIDGLDRARALHGIEGACTVAAVGTRCATEGDGAPLGYLWGVAHDATELECRLRAARKRIGVRLAESSAA